MLKYVVALSLSLAMSSALYAQRGGGRGKDKSPKIGDDAPNFKAKVLGKKAVMELKKEIKKVKKPIVLIFGSYT